MTAATSLAFPAAAAAVALVLLAGPAAGQLSSDPFSLTVGAFERPIAPLSETLEVPVTVTADCSMYTDSGLVPLRVALAVKDLPDWAITTLNPPALFLTIAPCPGTTTATAALLVSVTDRAPAFTPHTFEVVATTEGMRNSYEARQYGDMEAGYLGVVNATLATPTPLGAKPGSEVDVEVSIANTGNGPTAVTFTSTAVDGWAITPPDPITLENPLIGTGGDMQIVRFRVTTPDGVGYVDEAAVFRVVASPAYAADPTLRGMDADLVIEVNTKGVSVPGAPGFPALAALAGLAIVLRRRSERA